MILSDFIRTFVESLMILLVLICSTKVRKIIMVKSWIFFIAQDFIKKENKSVAEFKYEKIFYYCFLFFLLYVPFCSNREKDNVIFDE